MWEYDDTCVTLCLALPLYKSYDKLCKCDFAYVASANLRTETVRAQNFICS